VLAAIPPGDITSESIPALRKRQNDAATLEITLFLATSLLHTEKRYSLVPRLKATKARPALYHMHSGGMICGNRFAFFKDPLRWAKTAGVVAITVEYPLAPDNHFPAGLNDCYAGLRYVAEHSTELGIDANRLMVSGLSTGANLVAAVAIMARHRNGPRLCGVLLDCGMDDDRGGTVNINQYVKNGIWT
jgi:acetyl esterase/lipase